MMKSHKTVISLTILGLMALAGSAGAETTDASVIANEVESCVAEVRQNVDLTEATRIRHDVVAVERRIVGYEMQISTSVYGGADGDAIRAYAATCVVNGNNKPLSFAINQVS